MSIEYEILIPEMFNLVEKKCLCIFSADFGFARFLQDGVMAATLCGSPMYMVGLCFFLYEYLCRGGSSVKIDFASSVSRACCLGSKFSPNPIECLLKGENLLFRQHILSYERRAIFQTGLVFQKVPERKW